MSDDIVRRRASVCKQTCLKAFTSSLDRVNTKIVFVNKPIQKVDYSKKSYGEQILSALNLMSVWDLVSGVP